jgi:hypothetical protein
MTKLTTESPTRRETSGRHRDRVLCVELHPGFVKIWPKGTRQFTTLDWEVAYEAGLKMEFLQTKKEGK